MRGKNGIKHIFSLSSQSSIALGVKMWLVLIPSLSAAQTVWFAPNQTPDYNNLFTDSSAWEEARGCTEVFKFYINQLSGRWAGEMLGLAVPFLDTYDIKVAVESGGLRDFNGCGDICGESTASRDLGDFSAIDSAGGTLDRIAMDSPFGHTLAMGQSNLCNYTPEEAAREVADYMEAIHAVYPACSIGLIEPVPWYTVDTFAVYPGPNNYGDLPAILDILLDTLSSRGETLAFFHADCPYNYAEGTDWGWAKLAALQDFVLSRGVQFGLIYNSQTGGFQSDSLFYHETLGSVEQFAAAGGNPDHAVLQSWYEHPTHLLPETVPFTFTYLLREYCSTLIPVEWKPFFTLEPGEGTEFLLHTTSILPEVEDYGVPGFVILPDGTVRLTFCGPVGSATTTNSGETWTLNYGLNLPMHCDGAFVYLNDGRIRFLAEEMLSPEPRHSRIESYISSDGLNWTKEAGIRYAGSAYDDSIVSVPNCIQLPNGHWRMYYVGDFYGQSPTPNGIRTAISTDEGWTWGPESNLNILGTGDVDPHCMYLADGRFRLYHRLSFPDSGSGGIAFNESDDGLTFDTKQSQFIVRDSDVGGLALDPAVVRFPEGSVVVYLGNVGQGTPTIASLKPKGQRGDVDGDGGVDILDVVGAVNIVLEIPHPPTEYELWVADCNGDGNVDILDVVGIVNVVLGIGTCVP
ncbi:MAG: dockerin type I domain-containing protein [bacterium]